MELTRTFYIRLGNGKFLHPKRDYFVRDDGRYGGGGPPAFPGTSTARHMSYPSHRAGNAEVSNPPLGLRPQEVERTEKETVA